MSKKKPLTVDDAYALETPDDSVRLYGEWADTYDTSFLESSGYVVYQRITALMLEQQSLIIGAILDVGCGTGIVGECLREGGIKVIDGVDISAPMLAEAGNKKTADWT
jgi:predicted TPR repeat methyltransferase